jgi:hypothetical protein
MLKPNLSESQQNRPSSNGEYDRLGLEHRKKLHEMVQVNQRPTGRDYNINVRRRWLPSFQ